VVQSIWLGNSARKNDSIHFYTVSLQGRRVTQDELVSQPGDAPM